VQRSHPTGARAALAALVVGITAVLAGGLAVLLAAPASAHVVPSTVIELDVHQDDITAVLTLPADDLATASGTEIADGMALSDESAGDVVTYLEDHIAVTSAAGTWAVSVADIGTTATEQWGTGAFPAVTATATLTPPAGGSLRTFTLDYDAIVHQVVTADVYVVLHSDWAAGQVESATNLGEITLDTVSGTVSPLQVDLDEGSAWRGFTGMLRLGISHIAEGTDHQLFLLTLLLPAPLLAVSRRWSDVAPTGRAVRRISTITIAFTIGHSTTLALGALGLRVPQQPVEALIAVSILIAAAHALRPLFPGKEPLIAGLFGLVHGMAFAATLTDLDLSGGQLALSLLGFNLGIELMQLAVVLVVLPPLLILARTPAYRPLRTGAAVLTAIAALGWLLDRVGLTTPLGAAADSLSPASPWIVIAAWLAALYALSWSRGRPKSPAPCTDPAQAPSAATVSDRMDASI
jgi:hypothetical protein